MNHLDHFFYGFSMSDQEQHDREQEYLLADIMDYYTGGGYRCPLRRAARILAMGYDRKTLTERHVLQYQ